MEVLMAVALIGIAAVPMLRALTAVAQTANTAKVELRMMSVLQSTLTQYSRQSQIQPTDRPMVSEPDEMGVWTETVIEEMNEKNGEQLWTDESEQGGRQQLQQMYHIKVTAHFEVEGQRAEAYADTYRYGPLYRASTQ